MKMKKKNLIKYLFRHEKHLLNVNPNLSHYG